MEARRSPVPGPSGRPRGPHRPSRAPLARPEESTELRELVHIERSKDGAPVADTEAYPRRPAFECLHVDVRRGGTVRQGLERTNDGLSNARVPPSDAPEVLHRPRGERGAAQSPSSRTTSARLVVLPVAISLATSASDGTNASSARSNSSSSSIGTRTATGRPFEVTRILRLIPFAPRATRRVSDGPAHGRSLPYPLRLDSV